MTHLDEARRILALRGVDARNEVSKCQSVPALLHLSRMEKRSLVSDRIPGRLRKLGYDKVVPTDAAEFYRQIRDAGSWFTHGRSDASISAQKHSRSPLFDAPAPADPVVCTRCRETTARTEAEVELLFGHRQVPIKGGTKRARQPQCRKCRSKPPAGRAA